MIGTTLGRYRIVAKLGEGGMGSVWRAEDPALGRTVALKILSPALWASEAARQRFLREARAASRLDHPNIATVYDVGETDGVAWIAYQFIDGETVAARAANGPLPIAEAVTLATDTAAALAHAHENHVLHRDVTAGNVMVTREGRAVLVDFGLARPEGGTQLTSTGAMLGTAGYLAPEVLRGRPADERSDLYGLGAVLYRMVTGRLPFAGEVPEALLYRMLNEPVPPPSELRPELPVALERVMIKLLEREPADRFASATEVVEALREVVPGRGPGRAERTRRGMARRCRQAGEAVRRVGRTRVGVAALAGVALVGAALWVAAQRGWLPWIAHGPQVIAVLPFENTSVDPEEARYLAEGLGDELVSKLGEAARFRVLPWQSTRSLRTGGSSLVGTARNLHADALLVGSFRGDDERLRVTATLVDGRSGVVRWSRSFDELLSDMMTVQANIATNVSSAIEGTLAPAERAALSATPSSSPEAYEYYLRGTAFLNAADFQSRAFAKPYFEKALELDPNLAEAYVGRGAAMLDYVFRGTSGGIDAIRSARSDFRRALELRPGMVRAQRALVSAAYEAGHPEEMLKIAARMTRRGDNDVDGLLTRGWACTLSGFSAEAIPLFDRVMMLDPSNQEAAWFRVVALEWGDQHDQALARGKEFIRRFGEDPEIYTWMSVGAASLHLDHDAVAYMERALELFGDEGSDLYVIGLATNLFTSQGEAARADTLVQHWLPILRDRLTISPDNYRVLGVVIGLEAMAGDSVAMSRHFDMLLTLLAGDDDANPSSLNFSLPGIAAMLGRDGVERALRAIRGKDLASLHNALSNGFRYMSTVHRENPLNGSPPYQQLVSRVRIRVDELGRKYLPEVALRNRALFR